MRRIKDKVESKRRRNNIIMGIFLALIMVASILGYATMQSGVETPPNMVYNGFEFRIAQFTSGESAYVTKVGDTDIVFYFDPLTLDSVNLSDAFKQRIRGTGKLIFSLKPISPDEQIPQDSLYYDVLINDIQKYSGKTVSKAYQQPDLFGDLDVVSCEDATEFSTVIMLNYATDEYTSIKVEESDESPENCFYLTAQGADIIRTRDYLIYVMLGIMQ